MCRHARRDVAAVGLCACKYRQVKGGTSSTAWHGHTCQVLPSARLPGTPAGSPTSTRPGDRCRFKANHPDTMSGYST